VAFFASFNACGIPRFMCVIFKLKACLCGLLLYTLCVHGLRPLCFLINCYLLIKIKNSYKKKEGLQEVSDQLGAW
jgi:hypothetical protein